MERKEQTKRMKEKIIESAIYEFNEHGYEEASLNHVCKIGNISKGIIYHYFKDKDELYLSCVKVCYDTLLQYYTDYVNTLKNDMDIKGLMEVRMQFFKVHPKLRGLFFHSILHTPNHLLEKVNEVKKDLNAFNAKVYWEYLKHLELRVSKEDALMYLDVCQSAYNEYFRKHSSNCDDLENIIEQHESMIPQWIDFMLYGIAKER